MRYLTGLTLFSSISFLFFGIACLVDKRMKTEFIRYQLADKRVLTGVLQLVGAIGLLIGLYAEPRLAMAAAFGLSLLMFLGFATRIKIRDSWFQSFPSLFYAIINAYLAYAFYIAAFISEA